MPTHFSHQSLHRGPDSLPYWVPQTSSTQNVFWSVSILHKHRLWSLKNVIGLVDCRHFDSGVSKNMNGSVPVRHDSVKPACATPVSWNRSRKINSSIIHCLFFTPLLYCDASKCLQWKGESLQTKQYSKKTIQHSVKIFYRLKRCRLNL